MKRAGFDFSFVFVFFVDSYPIGNGGEAAMSSFCSAKMRGEREALCTLYTHLRFDCIDI